MKPTPDKTYFGPFTILEVERHIGDFTAALMKPSDTAFYRGPQGQRPLDVVGCLWWDCGCEVRGPSYEWMRTSHWAPCSLHAYAELDGPKSVVPERLKGGMVVPRDEAVPHDGVYLFEAVPYSL